MAYRIWGLLPLCVALSFFVQLATAQATRPLPLNPMRAGAQLVPLMKVAPSAQQVVVGVYPTTVYELSIETSTYHTLAYVWLRWKGDLDPTASLEFTNAVERWGFTKTNLLEKPETLPDGSHYQVLTVQGRFFQPFSLRDFPLDRQTLSISVEDSVHGQDQLVYIPDMQDSGFGAMLKIPGWQILGWRLEKTLQDYGSRFGEKGAGSASRYAGVRFELVIKRSISFFLWKLLLPLLIVLSANWLVLLLKPALVEVRTALPATALLTLVFLQKTYSDNLPTVGSLVLMDKIYAAAYLVVIVTMIQVIVTATWVQRADSPALEARVTRLDKRALIAQIVFFVLVVGTLVASVQYN
jgi:hypothetical protein